MFNDWTHFNHVWSKYPSSSFRVGSHFFVNESYVPGFANTKNARIRAQKTQDRFNNMNYTLKCNSLMHCARQWRGSSYYFQGGTVSEVNYYQVLDSYVSSAGQQFQRNSVSSWIEPLFISYVPHVLFWMKCLQFYVLEDMLKQVGQQDHWTWHHRTCIFWGSMKDQVYWTSVPTLSQPKEK